MKRYKIAIISILSIIFIVAVANIGLNFWIAKKLPGIINNENDSAYHIIYRDLDVSLLSRSVFATDVVLVPKNATQSKTTLPGFYAKVPSVQINNFHVIDLIFTNKIKADAILITSPEVILYKPVQKDTTDNRDLRSKVVELLNKLILVSEISMVDGDFKMMKVNTKKPILHVSNVSFSVDGIAINDDILAQKIPVSFGKYEIKFDSLYYKPDGVYELRTGKLQSENTSLSVENVRYLPTVSRSQFVQGLVTEKDLYTIKSKNLKIDSLQWGYKADDFFFNAKQIEIIEPAANIYRAKMPADDLTKKPLYSQVLREIPFFLKVNKVVIRHGTIEYEEEKTAEAGAGLLSFNGFNMTIDNVSSGFKQSKLPDVLIDATCKFMNTSTMNVKWSFNILDKSDAFKIKGNILKLPAEKLSPFIKPYMNVTADGMLDKVYFNYVGNDNMAKGDLSLEYEDLKVNVLQKDRKKKNKFVSAIANIFVKKDTKERVKNATVEVNRIQEKSFFNLLWRTTADGLKQLLI